MKATVYGHLITMSALLAGCGVSAPELIDPSSPTSPPVDHLGLEAWREIPPPPHSDQATAVVTAFYGTVGTPDIHWYGGDGLTGCDPGAVGWVITGSTPPRCVGGLELEGSVLVADAPDWMLLHDTGLAHELAHMRNWEVTGDDDVGHQSHWFVPGGEVQQATALLAEMGY
jgi:hypothetical protein